MTPKEKKDAANKILDDTMTVSQAKQRKLDLRAKDLEIRQGSLNRKKKNDAAAQQRRDDSAKKKVESEKSAASNKKVSDTVAGIRARKQKKADLESKKLEKIKGIAAERKAGVKKSVDRAKQVFQSGRSGESIDKDDGEGTAEVKMAKGVAQAGFAAARAGFNLAKAGAKARKAGSAQREVDRREKKIDARNQKLADAQDKKVSDRLNRRRMNKLGKLNPFRSKSSGSAADSTNNASEKRVAAKTRNDVAKSSTKSAAKVTSNNIVANPTRKSAASDPLAKASPNVRKPISPTRKSAASDPLAKASSNTPVRPARRALPPSGGVNKPRPQSKPSAGAGNMSDAERARKDPAYRKKLIQQRSKGMNEEFYQYLLEIEKKSEDKVNKVIDVMRGKNKIEISPQISEGVTGGILIQDAEDYTPLEIETVDVIKAKPLKEYSTLVRQGIKVGGKKGGRAVQAGEKAAVAKGQEMKAKAAKPAEAGKGEKIGAVVGGVAGGLAGGILDGPLPVGDIVGGIAGSKIGGAIGKKFDNKEKPMKEEASDAMKDRQLERGGMGARRTPKKPIGAPNTFGKKPSKKYDGMSAVDKVKASIRAQYGDKAIMDTKKTKKEGFSDWRGDLDIQEFIKFTDAAKRRAEYRKNSPTGGDYTKWKPGVDVPGVSNDLKVEPFKAGSNVNPVTYKDKPVTADMAKDYAGKKLSQAGDAVKGAAKSVGDYAMKNPGKAAAIGAGVVGAGLLAKKLLGGDKKKEQNEHNDWRSEMGIVEEEGKKDACYKKVKASAKVWPSAYASGRLVQCRKKGAANYGNSKSK
jgi:hypothetical protein